MAAVNIPHYPPWIVARWAFKSLLSRAMTEVSQEDAEVLTRAIALDGLHFDLLEEDRVCRLAAALDSAARQIRSELATTPSSDPRDDEFVLYLNELEMRLSDYLQ